MKELNNLINNALKHGRFRKNDFSFESHITLARVKFIKNKEEFVEQIKKLKVDSIEMDIDSFSLKKSVLTEKGPIYEDIIKFDI